jgi:hypothetical protein
LAAQELDRLGHAGTWTEATEPGRRSQLRQLAEANIPV